MPKIIPFKGIVYNKSKVKNLSKVVAPPYDIIPKKLQDELYKSSPYNMVRIELAKIKPEDNTKDNRYIRAAKTFELWLRNKIMVQDEKDAIYIYSQQYKDGGKVIDRIGFVALMDLHEGKKKVLPHEKTLEAPKVDRLDLMRSIKANLSPIFILYEDKGHKILNIMKSKCRKFAPFMDVNFEGIRNRAWKLDSLDDIEKIQHIMANTDTFIADGHHRFEVSRMYNKEVIRKRSSDIERKASGYVMAYFVESKEDILTVLPTHRAIKDINNLTQEEIECRLGKYFTIEKLSNLNSVMKRLLKLNNEHAFGMYLGRGRFYILRLKSMSMADKIMKDKPRDWRNLDVSILHLFILQYVLGIKYSEDNIEYFKKPDDTINAVDKDKFKMAFLLNATKVSQIKRIARIGEKMPRKATYFYPKPVSGVVINKLN